MTTSKINILFYIVCLFLFSCQETELDIQELNTLQDSTESSEDTAKIILNNGTELTFHNIDDNGLKGIFLMEESDCGECSVLDNLAKLSESKLTEQEIFWALSEPETLVPHFLKETSNNTKSKNNIALAQGWGRNVTKASPIILGTLNIACNNSYFTNTIAGGFIGDPEFVKLDKTPSNYSRFKNDCSNLAPSACNKGPRYRFSKTYSGIKEWKGKICSRAVQNSSNNHYNGYTLCYPQPCNSGSGYIGPELYFEYKWNGQWKSIKNIFQGGPKGFEVPANKTKVHTYSLSTSLATSFRLRVKNAMKKDQFDFMIDKKSSYEDGGSLDQWPDVLPQTPNYIKLRYGGFGNGTRRIEVDFTKIYEEGNPPRISLPVQFLPALPEYEGEVVFPTNFCGLRVTNASAFVWLDSQGEIIEFNDPNSQYNFFTESEFSQLKNNTIDFTGPIGACSNSNNPWNFTWPLTKDQTSTVVENHPKLIIELKDDSKIEFLNYNSYLENPLNALDLFKNIDVFDVAKFFEEKYIGSEQWLEDYKDALLQN